MTLDQLMSIAHAWLPCFDKMETYESILDKSGYRSFNVHTRFMSQFAEKEEDIRVHKTCYKEQCKVDATTSPVLRSHLAECRYKYYVSAYLENRKAALAKEEGFPSTTEWLKSTRPRWTKQVDPLIKSSLLKMNLRGQDVYEHFIELFREQLRPALESEASRCPKQPSFLFAVDRLKVFAEASENCLQSLGFKAVATKAKDYFAMDLDVGFGQVLRWSINEDHNFFLTNPLEAVCQPTLHVRPTSFRKKMKDSDRDSRYLVIPFHLLVEGLREFYTVCYDSEQIYLNVCVHATLLTHLLPDLLSAINRGIGHGGNGLARD